MKVNNWRSAYDKVILFFIIKQFGVRRQKDIVNISKGWVLSRWSRTMKDLSGLGEVIQFPISEALE